MVDPATASHIVLASTPGWSHFRTMCILAARLTAERPIVVTILVPYWMKILDQVNSETARYLQNVPIPRGLLRIIAVGEHSEAQNPAEIFAVGFQAMQSLWPRLIGNQSVECSATHTIHAPTKPPSVVLIDPFLYSWYPILRTSPKTSIMWYVAGTAAGGAYICQPGGRYTVDELLDKNKGRPQMTGRILQLAAHPPMYDWEFAPQKLEHFDIMIKLEAVITQALDESDGIVTTCSVGFDGEAALAGMDALATRNRPSFHLGPLVPFKDGTTEFSPATLEAELATAPPGVASAIQSFLDDHLTSKGSHSVIYICFGTHVWPKENIDHLWALLDALGDRGIPFVLSHSSPTAQIPSEIRKRYADSKMGLLVPWSPQQTVLAHKAVGWFVTHGGAGGTLDALSQGVPMIGWPSFGDQPSNIAYLTHIADVAFELIEVRTGEHGLKPLLPSGKTPTGTLEAFQKELQVLLDDMAGSAGARKRQNAKKHQAELGKAWSEGGPARAAFNHFVERFNL
ncbi:UDP-Glycosyltransferase/glycogen phosphorylase [Exidia glandulosa HHB12029]|uniref:UDP-Glycosyltransferase/glycogen phosphorylase n=1 Tax=Exidia glandulosa HHB12029 TaxID=1314781 RepID=A0A165PIE5_EXIGL|nr:UDP-Glycosyltransferase/glycogen phosphorylase [Exidia glandulosa HHB12029]